MSETNPDLNDILDEADSNEAQAERIKASKRQETARRTIRDLKVEMKLTRAERDLALDQVALLEELRNKIPRAKKLRARTRKRGGKLPASFVSLASDWHTCEIVSNRQTGGLNEHSMEIGHERAWNWARRVVTMCKREQETCDIESFVLWLGGDFMVNDSMHYKSERSSIQSPTQEARICRDLLGQIITYFRAELDVPRIVIPTSWGNHDRSTMKMVPGHGGDYSHIQEVYRDLQSWFSPDKSIDFRIAESEWEVCDVHGYKLLFHHGHYVRYGGGVGGLSIPLMKTVAIQRNDYDFDSLCIGHYHQRGIYQGGVAFTNGSLVGPNGYSMDNKFPSERPAQVSFLIDLERQEISNYYSIWGT